MTALMR